MALTDGDAMRTQLVDANGETIAQGEIGRISLEEWHDGGHQHITQIGERSYVFYDEGTEEFTVHEQDDVRDVIYYSVSENDGCYEERCVSFDVKPDLSFAKQSHVGSCRVWINTFYRDKHLRTSDLSSWVRGDDGEIIRFDSYSEPRKWINQDKKKYYTNGMYRFDYNEYDYRVSVMINCITSKLMARHDP